MNYSMPFNPFQIEQNNILDELYKIKKELISIEERLKILESKELKKENPIFLNSKINNDNGMYMI